MTQVGNNNINVEMQQMVKRLQENVHFLNNQ